MEDFSNRQRILDYILHRVRKNNGYLQLELTISLLKIGIRKAPTVSDRCLALIVVLSLKQVFSILQRIYPVDIFVYPVSIFF